MWSVNGGVAFFPARGLLKRPFLIKTEPPRVKLPMTQLRSDYQAVARHFGDRRCPDQLIEHYDLEVRLANELRASDREERRRAYGRVYKTLFDSLPHHPAHTNKEKSEFVLARADVLKKLVPKGAVFVEIGAGDCHLAIAMSGHCSRSIAIDVTDAVVERAGLPANFEFILTDGVNIGVPSNSADFVYSDQVMEHIHPEDAYEQIREILRILKPGGTYFCITPNRVSGPHDVSRYVDDRAKGFHLREYTYAELDGIFRKAGFSKATPLLIRHGRHFPISLGAASLIERAIEAADRVLGRRLRLYTKAVGLLGINMLARK